MTRKGDWIQTYSGRQFWPMDPRSEDVHFGDIAHALAHQCRYSGHCKTFYSVAQHSVLVSQQCHSFPLQGLLHDAAEAYLVDLPCPVKKALRAAGVSVFDDIEAGILNAVFCRFGLNPLDESGLHREVKEADMLLLATEARDLMAPLHLDWHHQEKNGYPVLPERISPWSPGRSEVEFLARFHLLTGQVFRDPIPMKEGVA